MTKLERLARTVVAVSQTNRFIGAGLQQAIDELSDFLDYLASPESKRGAPELMVDRSCAACGQDLPPLGGLPKAVSFNGVDNVVLPSPRESEAPAIRFDEPSARWCAVCGADLSDADERCPACGTSMEPRCNAVVTKVDRMRREVTIESFDPAEEETKP